MSDLDEFSELELDQLDLPKTVPNPVVSDEVNDFLRDQLVLLKTENTKLKNELVDRDQQLLHNRTQINDLMSKMKDFAYYQVDNSDYVNAQQVATRKIAELSKKLREKSSEIEVIKTKCSKLECTVADYKQQLEQAETTEEKEEKPADEPDLLKKLQEKLQYTSCKWAEEKNQTTKLKNDLKLANKWLQAEIGEKFDSLLTLNTNSNGNWRGRAQIIRDLQQKNQVLREKLKNYEERSNNSTNTTTSSSPSKNDKKLELLTHENYDLKLNLEDLKRKYDASRARCKVLESECCMLKTKMNNMQQRCENDQDLIASLTSQVSGKNARKSEEMKEKDASMKKMQQQIDQLKIEMDKLQCQLDQKSRALIEKNDEINILQRKVRGSRPPSSYQHRPENPDAKIISRLEVERIRLLELTEMQNKRLEEERSKMLKFQNQFKLEKQKSAKLEANILRMELEQKSCGSSSYSKLHSSTTNLRNVETTLEDKLELAEENVKALKTRLEIEIYERQHDIKEFAKILQNYAYK